jgi:hypothetical protein
MRLRLEPLSQNGGVLAIKPGYHSYGSRLPDYGEGDTRTDHSIRRAPDRTGPWWQGFASAHDWTFTRAHSGVYTEINKYTNRLRNAMMSPTDLRPDDVYAYTIGQIDSDRVVEGWNEYNDEDESGDDTHLWHRHDSFRRNIIGSFPHMWKSLTIDMGWTYAEWLQSIEGDDDMPITPADAIAIFNTDKTVTNPGWRADKATNDSITANTAHNITMGEAHGAHVVANTLLNEFRLFAAATKAGLANADDGAAVVAAVQAESRKLAELAAANEVNDQATAAALAKAAAELTAIRGLLDSAGGDPDLAPVIARLDALPAVIAASGQTAGKAAASAVLSRLATAQDAQAAALRTE